MRTVTNILKWTAIPALLILSTFSRFAAGYEFPLDLAICAGAVTFVGRAVHAQEHLWAAGFVPVAVVFSPLPLAIKIFLLLGFVCAGIFLTVYKVFGRQLARAA